VRIGVGTGAGESSPQPIEIRRSSTGTRCLRRRLETGDIESII
jgi:hypothetical protein